MKVATFQAERSTMNSGNKMDIYFLLTSEHDPVYLPPKPTSPPSQSISTLAKPKRKGNLFQCHLCPKLYQKISSRNKHIRNKHENRIKAVCRYCAKEFHEHYAHNRHIDQVHTRRHDYPCPYCPNTWYSTLSHRNIHLDKTHPYASLSDHEYRVTPAVLR